MDISQHLRFYSLSLGTESESKLASADHRWNLKLGGAQEGVSVVTLPTVMDLSDGKLLSILN